MARARRPGKARPAASGAGRSFGPIKSNVSIEGDIHKTIYTMSVPKAMREDSRAIAETIMRAVREAHGGGIGDYSRQHFIATFSGTMYEEDDPDSEKMGRATFGTYADDQLKNVKEDLRRRIKALQEGETPQTSGPQSKYGFFASGVSSVSVIVMEREGKRKRK